MIYPTGPSLWYHYHYLVGLVDLSLLRVGYFILCLVEFVHWKESPHFFSQCLLYILTKISVLQGTEMLSLGPSKTGAIFLVRDDKLYSLFFTQLNISPNATFCGFPKLLLSGTSIKWFPEIIRIYFMNHNWPKSSPLM